MFVAIIIIAVLGDQYTKYIVQKSFELNSTTEVWPGVLDLTYIHNYGAAFSILQHKQALLIVFTSVAMLAIVIYVFVQRKRQIVTERIALAFIVGGGLGNLINRVADGYVVDFINIYILPVFNVADMFVCVGCGLLFFSVMYWEPRQNRLKANREQNEGQ